MNDTATAGMEGVMAEEALSGELFSHLAEGALKACIAVSPVPCSSRFSTSPTAGGRRGKDDVDSGWRHQG